MIITLTKADFSLCKIGTLTTFNVRKSTVIGASVNIIKTSVERAGYSSATTIATIVLDEANYEGHAIKVMMGSTDVSSWYSVGKVIVPARTPITSNITISVSATAVSGGDPIIPDVPVTPTMYTFTINPMQTNATVTLTASGYKQSGNSISVPSNTTVSWTVSADGYFDKNGSETVTKDKTLNVDLGKIPDPGQPGTGGGSTPTGNLITLGTKQTNKKLGSGSSTPTSGDGYDVYEDIPVSAMSVYKFTEVYRSWWKTAEKTDIVSFNPNKDTTTIISPNNASYMSITTVSQGNPYVELVFDASSNTRPSGENIITNGTFNDNKALSPGSYSLTTKEGYYVYDKIPVTPGEIYKINGALRIWWLDSSQNGLKTENLNSVGGICVAPTNAAYISVTIASEQVPQSDAYMICLQ